MVTNTILADLRPVITNASETWVLKECMKGKLLITERNTGWFKKRTQFRMSLFPELYMVCEWST